MARKEGMGRGYALSWLGHLHALNIATTHSSTLILEDDTDWDIGIRAQMPQIAEAVRNLTGDASNATSIMPLPPFGTEWDILWLGHCGDSIIFDPPPITLPDPTVPPYINSWEKTLSPYPERKRYIHWSAGPICTYAYAVTGQAARKLVGRDDHGVESFDVWLHILCKGRQIRCVTVNPELFHHHEGAGPKVSLAAGSILEEGFYEKEYTENIWHSARCNSAVPGDELVTCMGKEPDSQ